MLKNNCVAAARVYSGFLAAAPKKPSDGGDFAGDRETAFVRPAVLFRNLQRTVDSREELLDRLATMLKRRAVWAGLGYDVRPVDCTAPGRNLGALHCLVNVLDRDGM